MGRDEFRSCLVATLLEDAGVPVDPMLERDVRGFVDDGLSAMPSHLRAGVASVAAMLRLRSRARWGKPFERLGPTERRLAIRSWEGSRLVPVRQYMRLLRSLVLFAAYERPVAADA